MLKPNDYENVKAATYGDSSVTGAPAPGGHGCIIKAAEYHADTKQLWLHFDIREGSESDMYYTRKYEKQAQFNSTTAKWQGTFKQNIYDKDGNTSPYFKGMISSIEKSNPGYTWNWDEASLKGKKVGMVFREEDFIGNDGLVHTTTRAAWACDIQSYADMPVPKRKEAKKPEPQPTAQASPWQDNEKLPF